jgi:CHAT domain-containing protein
MTAVDERAPEARIVHFATHGVLDEDSPADSYLLLADNRRLSAVDISTMDLSQTDIVVLSACESGVGSSGLEYATLARAFAHAKVPSVLASYWEVHDEATRQLMTNFYGVLQESDDVDYFSALSQAQRAMIAAGGKGSHPSAWSGFSIFGKP